MTLLTVMAAEDCVCQGDDRDGILLLSKCGAWRSLPAIFGERGVWNSRIAGEAQEKIYTLCWETGGKAERGPWEAESGLAR